MRKGKVDVLNEFKKERGGEKDLLNLVVVGHVDSGKSTLMGHLLYLLGQVSSRTMHKYENDSRKLGKQSFAYAWVLDETTEERERGITMDVGQNHFETPHKSVTLLDAPGHKDFIPNMISGAYQADVAVLVVNATRGEFEAGFEAGGQTREHAILVRSLGVSQLVVAVNKLDTVAWSHERFDEIVNKLRLFLKQVGFKEADVTYVPCSGFTGDNLTKPSEHLTNWNPPTPTLLHAIDSFQQPERLVEKPFRMSISDIFRAQSASSGGICVAGRIESGFVQKEDRVLVMPLNALANVRQVLVGAGERACNSAFAGEHVSLLLVGLPDQNSLADGMVACDPAQPIQAAKLIRARIVVFNIEVPITRGFPVVLHFGSAQTQAVIKRIVAEINKMTGEIIKNKPRCLAKNCNAIIEIAMDAPVCMELYANVKELGRFMLRSGGKTLAAGLVTEILQ
jgi:elongation factor 1 alpha-like protein